MLTILVVLSVVLLPAAGLLAVSLCRAPLGYEDENGFHLGPEPAVNVTELNQHSPAAVVEDLPHAA